MPGVSTSRPRRSGSRITGDDAWCAGRVNRAARTSRVLNFSSPISALTSVDFPTPEEPEQRAGLAGAEVALDDLDAAAVLRADGVHGNPNREGPDLVHVLSQMVGHVGLVEDHDRAGAALVRQHQVALEPARVVVAVEAHHEEHGVDVGGDDLLFGQLAGDLARKLAAPRQDGLDRRGGLAGRRPAPRPSRQPPTAAASRPRGAAVRNAAPATRPTRRKTR